MCSIFSETVRVVHAASCFQKKKLEKKGQNCWVGTKDTVLCRSAAQLEEMGMSNNTQARKKKSDILKIKNN